MCIFYDFLATFMWKTDLKIDIQDTGAAQKQDMGSLHRIIQRTPTFGKQEGHTGVSYLTATHTFIENCCWCRDGMICVV